MKFKTHNDFEDGEAPFVGGSLQGYMDIPYRELVKKLGEPHGSDGYKVDAEWDIHFEDGTTATIYNWKDGKNYNGSRGIATTKITQWHIGGDSQKSVDRVNQLFPSARTSKF